MLLFPHKQLTITPVLSSCPLGGNCPQIVKEMKPRSRTLV